MSSAEAAGPVLPPDSCLLPPEGERYTSKAPRASRSDQPVNVVLLRILRLVIHADSDPARQALFAKLVQSRLPVRMVYRLHEVLAGTRAAGLLVACFGLVSFLRVAPSPNRQARVLALATHANARRQVERIIGWIGPPACGWLRTGVRALCTPSGPASVATLLSQRRTAQVLRIVNRVDRRYGFLVSCRVSGAIAWYSRARAILDAHRPGAVLVSSDSHPEEVGFAAAARALRIPQVFVAHAYPTPLSPPLDFTLSILEGEAAVDARRRKGPIKGEVLLAGVEGDSFPLDASRFTRPQPVVGIFPPKALSWPTLAALVEECRRDFDAREILIRWHPSMLETPHLAQLLHDRSRVVETPRSASLQEIAERCDWVIGDENSNVHLQVLRLGIPTIAVRHLGIYPESRSDQYGFVANGVIFPPVNTLREIDRDAYLGFFSDCWAARFRRHDAAYLRPQQSVSGEVRRAVWQLFDPAAAAAMSA